MFTQGLQGQDKEIIDNGCAISMLEILTNVFPEYLEPSQEQNLTQYFLQPLLN